MKSSEARAKSLLEQMQTTTATPAFRKTAETFVAGREDSGAEVFCFPGDFRRGTSEIFSKQWVLVGHQSQIPEPGDYFVQEWRAKV